MDEIHTLKVEDGTETHTVEEKVQPLTYTAEDEARIYRKLDWNLMPIIFVLYSLSVLDRSNLGNAKIAGMDEDIDLSGRRYDWLATAFYIAYILAQWTVVGWKAFPPHIWASSVVFLWGFISTIQAACTSWGGLMASRVCLGIVEAMYGPGAPLYLSFFYPRHKVGLRIGIFLSGSALANAYGGALAYGISQAKGAIASWKILFIVEGLPTCVLAVVAWFFLPDSLTKARFLTPREKEIALLMSEKQAADETSGLQWKQVSRAFLDFASYLPPIMYFGCNVCFASLPLFVPTIISEMGAFNSVQSNGLSAPPYLVCFIVIIACTFVSDRTHVRGPFVIAAAVIAAIGFILLGTQSTVAVRYFAFFLATQIFVSTALVITWVGNTHSTESKRAGGYAMLMTAGQCGPILGTSIFPKVEGPYYRKGMWISCGACLLVAVAASVQTVLLWRENKKRDRLYGRNENDVSAQSGDEKQFRYII